jgi:DNA-binding transcriptional ArsR family regulator
MAAKKLVPDPAWGERALDALGDPTRRHIVQLLAEGPRSVGSLADDLPVTRPAVSQHLRILRDAELVDDVAEGTRRVYRLIPTGLTQAHAYLDRLWENSLAELKRAAENP